MAINYTYPIKAVPTVSDNVLIIDNEDTTNPRSTKTATIQSIVNLASGGGGGGGDVTGPASSVDLSIPVFDGTSGKIIKDATGVTIDANGNVTLDAWPETDAEFRGDIDGAVRFTAQADENLSFGDVVYISGASGSNTLVRKAQSNSLSTMPAFGFAFKTTISGDPVQVVTFGNIYGSGTKPLDTTVDSDGNSITIGDTLYVSPTTPGGWTNVRPTGATELVQNIGKVTRVNANNGVIKAGGAGRVNATPNTISITGSISGSQVVSQKFTTDEVTITGGGPSPATFTHDVDTGSVALITITDTGGNVLRLANLPSATPVIVKVQQGGTTAPWPNITSYIDASGGTIEWSGGTAPTITQTNGQSDILTFVRIGTNVYASIIQNFS